jgi:hypothetical protein
MRGCGRISSSNVTFGTGDESHCSRSDSWTLLRQGSFGRTRGQGLSIYSKTLGHLYRARAGTPLQERIESVMTILAGCGEWGKDNIAAGNHVIYPTTTARLIDLHEWERPNIDMAIDSVTSDAKVVYI